jgi:predicted kinase
MSRPFWRQAEVAAASIHLVCGLVGAGKTTYARELAERLGAMRFSIDEWMSALFWMDSPDPIDPRWAAERIERCTAQILAVAGDVVAHGMPCVLDLGFVTAAQRGRVLNWAGETGFAAQLHLLDVPADVRWRRVEERNRAPGEAQLPFAVSREMFDFVESLWEPPTEAEMRAADGVRLGA